LIRIPTFDVDIVEGDEEISLVEYGIPGKVIHTPGYSLGSVRVLLENGEAFVGDLAMNMVPLRLKPGLPIFGDSLSIVKNSILHGCKDSLSNACKPFREEILYKSLEQSIFFFLCLQDIISICLIENSNISPVSR
jgi:hypothetical protein